MPRLDEQGFSLIELSVVIGVTATVIGVSIPVYQGIQEQSMLEAAKASLLQIRKKCVLMNSFNKPNNLTVGNIRGYTLQSSSSNCNIISAIANNNNKYPSFHYNFNTNEFSCTFQNAEATPYPECKKINGENTLEKTPEPSPDKYIVNLETQIEKELKAKEVALAKKKEEELVLQAKFQEELGSRCGTPEDFNKAKSNIERLIYSSSRISKMRGGPPAPSNLHPSMLFS